MPFSALIDPTRARDFLTLFGYEVVLREHGWAECLLVRGDERWIGAGLDADAALRDALVKAFPSHAAQTLLAEAIGWQEPHEPPAPEADAVASEAQGEPPASSRTDREEGAIDVSAPSTPKGSLPVEEAPPPPPAEEPARFYGGAAPERAPELRADSPKASPREILAGLRELRARMDADREDLGAAAPKRQRLVFLAWAAEARALQDALPDDERVYAAVRGICGTIGTLAGDWWPGNVPALQLSASPTDALKTLDARGGEPRTWAGIAELAEETLRDIEAAESAAGFDPSGWADRSRLRPPPTKPEALLREIVAEVERVGGPLGVRPDATLLPSAAEMARWACHARWLRESAEDPALWAKLCGRLRFWSSKARGMFREADRLLDPEYAPGQPWATIVLGAAEAAKLSKEAAQRTAEVEQVLRSVPATDDRDALRGWLLQALPLTDTHHAEIVAAVAPFREIVAAFEPKDFGGQGRRIRRRLKKMQEDLAGADAVPPPPVADTKETTAADDEPPARGRLLDRVAAHTRGKRALFISNRADPELHDRLLASLGFELLDWVEAEPRRLEAVAESVASRGYDFVLGATGFLDHAADRKLILACNRARTSYVRVCKGREGATVRALARDLGLEEG
jgi:hypothetical protein